MMKNSKMMIGACALAISLGASAQTQYDAARLMGGELNGNGSFRRNGWSYGGIGRRYICDWYKSCRYRYLS